MPTSINPYTLEPCGEYKEHTPAEVSEALCLADSVFDEFKETAFSFRADRLNRLADLLISKKKELSELMTREMGKPITQSKAEIEKCAWVCRFYAEEGSAFLQNRLVETDAAESYVKYEPLGVILAVMPWNFPLWQVFRFAAPTLMAGNTALLKHASNVTGCSLAIQELIEAAGFQKGVFQSLVIPGARVEEVLKDTRCKGVSLTGSEAAGSAVAALAGKYLKPSVMELGGSNPFIVHFDADLERAVQLAVNARIQNNGQSCIAAKRFLIHTDVVDEFTERLKAKFANLVSGDPISVSCQIGPLARVDLAEELESQLKRTLKEGAYLICGGKRRNAFFEPTIVTGVRPGMSLWDEETFGPVAAISTYSDLDSMLTGARHATFGLGVTLCTTDLEWGKTLITKFEEGAVFINEMVKSDPRLPFGGVKRSGYGRELSLEGIRAFVNAKTVYLNH